MIKVYGINNCQSVRRAKAFFDNADVRYDWIDWKATPPGETQVKQWLQSVGDKLVNRQGMTWRRLSDDEKNAVHDSNALVELILRHPMLIKRPLIEWQDGEVSVGFDLALFNDKIDI